ncbi:hypothetical protein FIV42_00715 [Persicimonas caeni]|uniref:Uncharacterized protein n=1 Tax=Persicimonas caeni TaxID=2292766 RepID=A0A4Y6PLW8_PERCE|nr:hypothetical protein [Persicimonas caeni]QDG49306.1 hypothetical protein FIV42_00715 [Persicimonas caeni]QED30527.1 hypothetical protein FRD00_00710 [Persicimonas caeni]
MPFDQTQINDARAKEVYKGLKEEGELKTSMVDVMCQKVPKSAIPGIEGKIKSLDFQAIVATNSLSGFRALDATSEEMGTPVSDRDFKIQKIQNHKSYARGLEGDQLFQKIKESFVPHLDTQAAFEKDFELNTILSGSGTAVTNAQDVTVRQLSAGASETWDDPNSDPLGDLRSAVQDSLADTVYLGTTKQNQLQDHDQFQSQTGWKYATSSQIASFLEDYLKVQRVILNDVVYQNGAITDTADVKRLNADQACAYNSANLLYLDWSDMEFVTEDVKSDNVRKLHGIVHGSIIVVVPDFFIAFQDVA